MLEKTERLSSDEVAFWDMIYMSHIEKGYNVYDAAAEADWAVLLRRERWGATEGIYR